MITEQSVAPSRTKTVVAAVAAVLLGIIFLVSGGWKVLSPMHTGELLEQARVPAGWGPLGAAALGTVEVLAAVLLFLPQTRKWGGILGSALLIFFIGWIGYYYQALVGQECSCFPLIKRAVGPGFFLGDAVMLLLGVVTALWANPVRSMKIPATALATLVIIAGANFALAKSANRGIAAPSPLIVDGKSTSVDSGKVFLFFYDPQCMHCDAAARFMSKWEWNDTKVIGVPTTQPQWAAGFLHDTGFKAGTDLEVAKLRKVFQFVDPPYGVALKNGHQVAAFNQAKFTAPSPKADMQKLGFVK